MLETMSHRRRTRLATHLGVGAASLALMIALYHGLPAVYALYQFDDAARKHFTDTIFRLSLSSAYVALALLVVTLTLGAGRVWQRRKRTPVHFDARRDVAIWAGLWSIFHGLIGLLVHYRGRGGALYYFVYPSARGGGLRFDGFGWANYTGVIAVLVVLFLLALSNDFTLRKLGAARWKRWQRGNYVLLGVTLAHTVLYAVLEQRPRALFIFSVTLFSLTLFAQGAGIVMYRRALGQNLEKEAAEALPVAS